MWRSGIIWRRPCILILLHELDLDNELIDSLMAGCCLGQTLVNAISLNTITASALLIMLIELSVLPMKYSKNSKSTTTEFT
eukprot:Awhi_evm1s6947